MNAENIPVVLAKPEREIWAGFFQSCMAALLANPEVTNAQTCDDDGMVREFRRRLVARAEAFTEIMWESYLAQDKFFGDQAEGEDTPSESAAPLAPKPQPESD